MTKIGNTGAGGIRPPATESTENVKQTTSPGEAIPDKASPSTESAGHRETTGDKYAAGDLKTAGNRVKEQLDKLAPKSKEVPKPPTPSFAPPYVPVGPVVMGDNIATPGAMAPSSKEPPKPPTPNFAPPYVPVGPVVMGDNIAAPGAMSGETQQMNLKPDQFNINDQGNLVITNQKLIDFFKSLKEKAQGDINLLISNLKLPDKE